MENVLSYFKPNFIVKRSAQSMVVISVIQTLVATLALQLQTNNMIPRPSGIIPEGFAIVMAPGFTDNFLTTFFFILKGMGIASIISMLFCYIVKIDALAGFSRFISKTRYLSYSGILFALTVILHDSGQIKLWALVVGIVPYFVTSLLSYIDSIAPSEYKLCYTLKMNNWQILWEVIIVGKLDLVVEVIRQNFAIGWMMICFVEGLCWSEGGLGTMLVTENRHFRMDKVFAIVAIIIISAWFFDYLFGLIGCWIFPYTNPERNRKLWINRLVRELSRLWAIYKSERTIRKSQKTK